LFAQNGEASEEFGAPVALDGDTMVVGVPLTEGKAGLDQGAAYVFERDLGGPEAWGQAAKLVASDGTFFDLFGVAVAISVDTIVVTTANDDDLGSKSGSAYVFERDAGGSDSWGEVAKLTADDGMADDVFGTAVAIYGDTIVVGAVGDDDLASESGAAYVFERDEGGAGSWGQVAKILADDGALTDRFGGEISIDGDTIAVGVQGGDPDGSVYIYGRDVGAPGAWGQVLEINPPDAGGGSSTFGGAVALDGDTLFVGDWSDAALGGDAGSAYVFGRDVGGPNVWGLVRKFLAADGESLDFFGAEISLSGDVALIAAAGDDDAASDAGAVYVYARNAGGRDSWGRIAKLISPDPQSQHGFGDSIGVEGNTLIIGASRDNDLGTNAGAAYVFLETQIDATLEVTGTCPGLVTVTATGGTPGGELTLWNSRAEGSYFLEIDSCVGTELGLDVPRIAHSGTVDEDGSLTGTREAEEDECGRAMQLLDQVTCTTSNLVNWP